MPTSRIKACVKNANDPGETGQRYRNLGNGDQYLLIDHFIFLTINTALLTTIRLHAEVRRLSKTLDQSPLFRILLFQSLLFQSLLFKVTLFPPWEELGHIAADLAGVARWTLL